MNLLNIDITSLLLKNLANPEVISVCLALMAVGLFVSQNPFSWVFDGFHCVITIFLVYSKNLIFESILYVFYSVMAIRGFCAWYYCYDTSHKEPNYLNNKQYFNVHTCGYKENIITIIVLILICLFLNLMVHLFDYLGVLKYLGISFSLPLLDSFTTVFSIYATIGVVSKKLESWLYWIVVDTTNLFMYQYKGLQWFLILNIVYILMDVVGFLKWYKFYSMKNYSSKKILTNQ